MKRVFCLFLAIVILFSACGKHGERFREPVTFYYLRRQFPYGENESILGTEAREASGHRDDLRYLLALYLMGPSGDELRSPVPRGTNIYLVEQTEESVTLKLSSTANALTDAEFSLVCACLSLTCMSLTGAESVTIVSGSRTITMRSENLILYDIDSGSAAATEETQ